MLIFCMLINIKVSCKLILTFSVSVSYKVVLSLLISISLQYLKKVRKGVHFLHAEKYQSFYKLHYRFRWKWLDMFKVPKIFAIFLQSKEKILQLLLCSIVIQNYWMVMLKNKQDLIDQGTLKSGVSHTNNLMN